MLIFLQFDHINTRVVKKICRDTSPTNLPYFQYFIPFFNNSLRASFIFSTAKAICMRVESSVFERDTGEALAAPITWTCCVLSPFDIFTQKRGVPFISGLWGSSSRPYKLKQKVLASLVLFSSGSTRTPKCKSFVIFIVIFFLL